MLRILILNLGSTSFKCKLFGVGQSECLLATAGVESIGASGTYRVSTPGGETEKGACTCLTHAQAMTLCMEAMRRLDVSIDMKTLDAVGYKAVHGGDLSGSQFVTPALLAEMERMVPLAPAHNPVYLAMMRNVAEQNPGLTQIACFETAFHQTMPQERAVYGVPYTWMTQYGIRRYGFHGSSHSYIAWKMQQEAPYAKKLISIHLGGSSSMCAISDGKSIATTMGATPQSGLFHNNRVGDLDVFALPVMAEKLGSMEEAINTLSKQSGFLGLSGVSNDLRDIEKAASAGNKQAELAIAAFVDAIVGYIGMYTAFLGGVDALVFTGGIGRNSAMIRQRVADRLVFVNAQLDAAKNAESKEGKISADCSGVAIWTLETNEELMVMRGCAKLLQSK